MSHLPEEIAACYHLVDPRQRQNHYPPLLELLPLDNPAEMKSHHQEKAQNHHFLEAARCRGSLADHLPVVSPAAPLHPHQDHHYYWYYWEHLCCHSRRVVGH